VSAPERQIAAGMDAELAHRAVKVVTSTPTSPGSNLQAQSRDSVRKHTPAAPPFRPDLTSTPRPTIVLNNGSDGPITSLWPPLGTCGGPKRTTVVDKAVAGLVDLVDWKIFAQC
jgi:hypothetical protein